MMFSESKYSPSGVVKFCRFICLSSIPLGKYKRNYVSFLINRFFVLLCNGKTIMETLQEFLHIVNHRFGVSIYSRFAILG